MQHEDQTIKMFDFLIKMNDLNDDMKKYNLKEHDKKFIKAMVLGLEPETVPVSYLH